MALVECRECEKEVSTEAPTCPHCGIPNPAPTPVAVVAEETTEGGSAGFILVGGVIVGALLLWLYFSSVENSAMAPPSGQQAATSQPAVERLWVTADRLNRRTCPSAECGIVGFLFYREAVIVLERQGNWVRSTRYYAPLCTDGQNEFVDEGNARCDEENGLVNGTFAEWVNAEFLSDVRPADPAADATGLAALVGSSDDFRIYEAAFVEAAQSLMNQGRCTEADFRDNGGWWKSTTTYSEQPVYFIYCGGSTIANRIYLNAETGEIFQ
jgi:hypothetical protein